PTFNRYETMTKDDVVHLKFDGAQLSRGRHASTEYRLHVAIYRARPKARCVIHTHSPYAAMLSVVRRKIPILMEEMVLLLGGAVEVSEFGIAHTDDVGENALKALGTTNAVLLANHGVLVCGRTVEYAVKTAELVEKMAWIYWGSSQIGEPVIISEKAHSKLIEDYNTSFATH
ncbi:MAG: class II aldolase/adducin family protein, partial [Nitrososphaerales archaeon]